MHVRDREQKTVRKGQKHKGSRTPVKIAITRMSDVVGFCTHCMAVRNMRTTQVKKILEDKKRTVGEIIITYHGETCGLFVKDEYSRPVD